jgi:hypothetical protein
MVQLITQYTNKTTDNTISNLYPLRNVQINLQMHYTKTKSSRHANRTNNQQTHTGSVGLSTDHRSFLPERVRMNESESEGVASCAYKIAHIVMRWPMDRIQC